VDTGDCPEPSAGPSLGLVEPQEVHTGLLLKLVQVPFDGILSLRRVSHTTPADRSVVRRVLLSTLFKNGCNFSLFAVTRD